MKKQFGFAAFEIFIAALALLGVGGWVANLVKLIGMIDGSLTTMFVIRIVGVFAAPVGAVLGYF